MFSEEKKSHTASTMNVSINFFLIQRRCVTIMNTVFEFISTTTELINGGTVLVQNDSLSILAFA